MDELDSQGPNMLNEVSTGYSTPSSSSLDTCDSGFTEMYPSNLNSNSSIGMDDKSSASDEIVVLNTAVSQTQSSSRVDSDITSDIQINSNVTTAAGSSHNFTTRLAQNTYNNSQGTLVNALEYKTMGINEVKYNTNGDERDEDETDNFDEVESIASDMSDLSDAFKLNSDITPEMQRSINWVRKFVHFCLDLYIYWR